MKPVRVNRPLLSALGLGGPQTSPTWTKELDLAKAEGKRVLGLIPKKGVVVHRIEKVQNPFLKKAYELRRLELGGDVREETLFHGTSPRNADRICRVNFDWRLCGANAGKQRGASRFGSGVYFSSSFNYTKWYSDCATDGEQVVILAKVLVGKSCTGKYSAEVPPSGYNTTQNDEGFIFVKYEDHEFCPVYKVHYRREETIPNRYHPSSSSYSSSNCQLSSSAVKSCDVPPSFAFNRQHNVEVWAELDRSGVSSGPQFYQGAPIAKVQPWKSGLTSGQFCNKRPLSFADQRQKLSTVLCNTGNPQQQNYPFQMNGPFNSQSNPAALPDVLFWTNGNAFMCLFFPKKS